MKPPIEWNGRELKRRRIEAGMTQLELASRIRRQQNEVSNWEAGRYSPYVGTCAAIARVLGCKIEDLLIEETPLS